jgi:hypothetical protein
VRDLVAVAVVPHQRGQQLPPRPECLDGWWRSARDSRPDQIHRPPSPTASLSQPAKRLRDPNFGITDVPPPLGKVGSCVG